jgi:hypothetical protein
MFNFRARFLDPSAAIVREMYISAWTVEGAVALLDGIGWPLAALRIAIQDVATGREAHSEERQSLEVANA